MSPKEGCVLSPRTCEDVTLHGERDFEDVRRILRWKVVQDYWGGNSEGHASLEKGAGRSGVTEDVRTEAEVRCCGATRQGGQATSSSWESQEMHPPRASRRSQPCRHLESHSLKLILNSCLQSCEVTDLCHCKALRHLWQFVIAAIRDWYAPGPLCYVTAGMASSFWLFL